MLRRQTLVGILVSGTKIDSRQGGIPSFRLSWSATIGSKAWCGGCRKGMIQRVKFPSHGILDDLGSL